MKKIIIIFKRKNWFEKLSIIGAILFILLMLIIGIMQIGWWTVFTSVAIGIVYDEIKGAIKEFKNIEIEEKEK